MNKLPLILISFLIVFTAQAQIFYSNGATVQINNGGILYCNGGVLLSGSTQLNNEGEVTTTRNSTLNQPGDFQIDNGANVTGNGIYSVEQDWINDGTFNGGSGEVVLYGDIEQLITSNNGTVTVFNNLTLTGSGAGIDRRKTLLGVDAVSGAQGVLQLNDRELNTDLNTFTVLNNAPIAILYSTTFNDEGFVSSTGNGFLIRHTNTVDEYIFPVGSSDGTRRFRPVEINPNTSMDQAYAVRMNNYSAGDDAYYLTQHESTIDEVNSLFYHSIESLTGGSHPDLRIYFIPNEDNDWASIANWSSFAEEWQDLGNTEENELSNFKAIEQAEWTFPYNDNAYALVNTSFPFIIPNVFTPNNDGENDVFYITSAGLKEYDLVILNRWGNVVFESNDPEEGWDGTLNGEPCTEGVYFYKLNAQQNKNEIKEHGFITLIRK